MRMLDEALRRIASEASVAERRDDAATEGTGAPVSLSPYVAPSRRARFVATTIFVALVGLFFSVGVVVRGRTSAAGASNHEPALATTTSAPATPDVHPSAEPPPPPPSAAPAPPRRRSLTPKPRTPRAPATVPTEDLYEKF
jgi:hypothetical protein